MVKEWIDTLHKDMSNKFDRFLLHPYTSWNDCNQKSAYPWRWS